ncbi:exocyst complex component Sec3-domain-containing protein [Phycomyces nitens]|nr:exocyst complex component Sec3-domain-containing protein [Phycomyces nitens]
MATDAIRQAIISSLFSSETGGGAERLLIHVKVFEDVKQTDGGGNVRSPNIMGKPRYLCLTQKRNKVRLYKTKRNQTGTFSIGKAWSLDDIRQIEVVDANQFAMTLNKQYLWAVEIPRDKMIFLAHVVDACQRFLSRVPKLVNVDEAYLLRFIGNSTSLPVSPTAASPPIQSPSINSDDASANIPYSQHEPSFHSLAPPAQYGPVYSVQNSDRNLPMVESPMTIQSPMLPPPPVMSSSLPPSPLPPSPSVARIDDSPRVLMENKDRERDERKERDRARELRREREKREKAIEEEKAKRKRMADMQDKMAEQASLMNVEELLTDFNWKASGNAAALEKRLLGELHALEAANVHAIIQSDERVRSVVQHIDNALEELDSMESWLFLYSAELNSMGDDIREIESQNRGLQILTSNQHHLITELDELLSAISIPRACLESLKYDPMETVEDIERIQSSAERLQKVLKIKLDGGLQDMKAVQEKLEAYNVHSNTFCSRINEFLKNQFDQQAKVLADSKTRVQPTVTGRKPQSIVVHPHESAEDGLIRYQGFSLWEKELEPRMYNELQRYYAQAMAPLYEKDIRELMDATRGFYTTLRNRGLDELEYIFRPEESRPVRALAYGADKLRGGDESRTHRYRHILRGSVEGMSVPGLAAAGGANSRTGVDEEEKLADDAFSQMISQGAMLVGREQNFMSDLFQIAPSAPKSFLERGPVYTQVPSVEDLCERREKIRDVKISKKILTWMELLFETLEPSLVSLIEYGVKSDPTQTVSMMSSVEFQQEERQGSDQEFTLRLCASLTQRLKRMFERFITDQIRIIEETKVSSKKRRGILPFFRTFPIFALRLEMAAATIDPESETRKTVNEAYERVINGMMASLDSIARESDQTGDDKEQLNANIMYIENMHHFYHELRTHKLHVLERWIKHAKSQYDSRLNAYIKVIIRRPLGKLLEFFEGVEAMMHTSTPEEVSFHMNYNKAQLRKVIMMYPAKEIKKSLEQLYRRVDKHFSEEEGLLQVVWRGIQEDFIRQHEKMEDLIQKCYPDAGVHLEFSIPDLLAMMSELARKVNI